MTDLLQPGLVERARTAARLPLYRSSFALIVSSLSNAALGLLFWVAAARLYAVDVVGLGAAGISALQLVAIVGWVGLQFTLMRYVPTAGTHRRRVVALTYASGAAAALLIAAVFVGFFSDALGASFVRSSAVGAVVFCLSAGAWAVFSLEDAALVGIRRAGLIPAENGLFGVLKLVLVVVLASQARPWTLLGSWIAASVVLAIIVNIALFWRLLDDPSPAALPPATVIVRFSAGHSAVGVTGWFPDFLVPLLVLYFSGKAANAYYYSAWTIGFAIRVLIGNMASALTVEAAYQGAFRSLARSAIRLCLLVMTPATVGLVVFAGPVLTAFGHDYAVHGATLLRLLALSIWPSAVVAFAVAADRNRQRFGAALVITVIGSLGAIGLDLLLIPRYGITGAGLGWLGGQSIAAVVAVGWVVALLRSRRRQAVTPTVAV